MRAAGWKQKWFKPLEAVEQRAAQIAQEAEMAKGMQMAQQVAETAKTGAGGLAQGDKVMDALAKAPAVAQQLEAANAAG